MKKKVISLLICSALMMVEGVTYAQTIASEPSNNSKIESSAEEKEQKKSKETSEEAEEKSSEDKCKKTSQDDIEEMLLNKYFSNRNQITIEDLTGNSLNNEEMINEGYKLANREIGYRIENLK